MYTREIAKENRKIQRRARELLAGGESQSCALSALSTLMNEFPTLSISRLRRRLDKVVREMRGEVLRSPGGQPGNQNAAKNKTKTMLLSVRLDGEIIDLIRARAQQLGVSQGNYIKRLVIEDHL